MDRFKIGERVVCINDKRRWYKLGGLKKHEIYTVVGFNPYDDGLILREIKSPKSGFNAYAANRFRKLDYAFVDKVLQTIVPQRKQYQPKVRITNKARRYNLDEISSLN